MDRNERVMSVIGTIIERVHYHEYTQLYLACTVQEDTVKMI